MADTPLLSCPFCGQPPEWNMGQHGDGSPWEYLACSHCEAMGPAVGNDDKTEAIVRWNTRADDKAKLLDEVERLRAALTKVADAVFANREGTADHHELVRDICLEVEPLLVAVGLSDDGDGWGFSEEPLAACAALQPSGAGK